VARPTWRSLRPGTAFQPHDRDEIESAERSGRPRPITRIISSTIPTAHNIRDQRMPKGAPCRPVSQARTAPPSRRWRSGGGGE